MKNIHLLPTDKPSRLCYDRDDNLLFAPNAGFTYGDGKQHLYITSNEEIKEGDCFIGIKVEEDSNDNSFVIVTPKNKQQYKGSGTFVWVKKIILTTDKDLIVDGVQAIDDTFLEWFVKNSSCEEVEVDYRYDTNLQPILDSFGNKVLRVKIPTESSNLSQIIIPQEEPKQENCCTPIGQIKRYKDCKGCDRKPKQETIEEAAERYLENVNEKVHKDLERDSWIKIGFIAGAKWQAERMYGEEDLREAFRQGQDNVDYSEFFGLDFKITEQEWFEQFKKTKEL
jgi:hypothetical protein